MAYTRLISVYSSLSLLGILLFSNPASGSISVDFKGGVQTVQNPISLQDTTRSRYEVEFANSNLVDDHIEVGLSFGGASVSSITDTYTTFDSLGMIQDTFEDKFRMYDVRLGMRLYPINPIDRMGIHPYVGGGLGYYWLVDSWKDTHLETINSPYSEITEEDSGSITLAKGFFPYVTAGMEITVTPQAALLLEYKQDFQKKEDGVDYGGSIYMVGMRFRW